MTQMTTVQTTANRNAFPLGSKVKVAEAHETQASTYNLVPGQEYTVAACKTSTLGWTVDVTSAGSDIPLTGFGSDWFVLAEAPEERAYIPFTLTKETSKAYATKQASRSLEADTNAVLRAAGRGEEVDAWAFHTAVTAALSLAATRDGQSMGRRNWTRECRHLLYISGAVIENSLRGLPPVDPGTRSPKIAEQKREIDDLRNTVSRLAAEAQQASFALEEEKARVGALIAEKTDLQAINARWVETNGVKRRQFDYAMSLLDSESRFKVVGYGDALAEQV